MTPSRRIGLLLMLLAAGAACGEGTFSGGATFSLVLRIEVVDSAGSPVPGTEIMLTSWPAVPGANARLDPAARTDSSGILTISVAGYPDPSLDSLRISAIAPGCVGVGQLQDTVLTKPSLVQLTGDTAIVRLVHRAVYPAAHTAVGELCAFGDDSTIGPEAHRLGLRVDSIVGATVHGRWRLNFSWTRGDDFGAFVGSVASNSVVLNLVHDAPWGSCTGLQVTVPVRADGSWDTGLVTQPQGCLPAPQYFEFVSGAFFNTWP